MAEDGLLSKREKCTCRVAVRFPDERSEELSQRESRKRVRVATAKSVLQTDGAKKEKE